VSNGRSAIKLTVNDEPVVGSVEARRTLADFLREDLGLHGTKIGCEHGVCGACTVLLDGEPVLSCLLFAVQAHGRSVGTIEGASGRDGALSPVQEAFRRNHALQCGFCTPGFVLTATAFLDLNPAPTEDQVREALSGNICRCTGYDGLVKAVLSLGTRDDGEER
jgi:carbon-monoxide dehydrogenase small subunit